MTWLLPSVSGLDSAPPHRSIHQDRGDSTPDRPRLDILVDAISNCHDSIHELSRGEGPSVPTSFEFDQILIDFVSNEMDSNDIGSLTIWQDIEEKQHYSEKI
jgi:hypothetical protein